MAERLAISDGFTLDLRDIDLEEGFERWRNALRAEARQIAKRKWWHDELGFGFEIADDDNRPDACVRLAAGQQPGTRIADINQPAVAGDTNKRSHTARGSDGRQWLFRQGYLKTQAAHSADKLPDLDFRQFRDLTGCDPLFWTQRGNRDRREWWPVAPVGTDATPAQMVSSTAQFVELCVKARSNQAVEYGLEQHNSTPSEELEPDGRTGRYEICSQAAREAVRCHGAVVNSLTKLLRSKGLSPFTYRSIAGYSPDIVLKRREKSPLLIEVKTSSEASDIHCGVGQLILYPRMFSDLEKAERVLLVPAGRIGSLSRILEKDPRIHYSTYLWTGAIGGLPVRFDADLYALCGITI